MNNTDTPDHIVNHCAVCYRWGRVVHVAMKDGLHIDLCSRCQKSLASGILRVVRVQPLAPTKESAS